MRPLTKPRYRERLSPTECVLRATRFQERA